MLTIEEQTKLIDYCFDILHPEICKDDFNIALIAEFVRAETAGMGYLNRATLEWAINSLAGKLHYYQHVDISQQLAAGAEAQAQLDAERQEKQRKDEILRRELERDAREALKGPSRASAYGTQAEMQQEAAEQAAQRKASQDAEVQLRDQRAFSAELREANKLVECMSDGSGRVSHSKTASARAAARERLKAKYPQWASRVIPNPE